MPNPNPDRLRQIKTFPSLVKYLRDDLGWLINSESFDELTFDYEPEELGLDAKAAVNIKEIKQLRPLVTNQPWGIFFVNFEPKRLPVVVLRRILRSLVIKKRQSANRPQQAAWKLHDLLFISSYGEDQHRDITFAHFSEDTGHDGGLPTLRVLGWDDEDTVLHLAHAHATLMENLRWPEDDTDLDTWRLQWSAAFTLRHREVINTSKTLAVRMAELASAIRKRANRVLAVESEKGPLRKLMSSFKEALIHDLSDDDFADMYAQTITYGLLTARVSRHVPGEDAVLLPEDVSALVLPTNPFLKELMQTFFHVGGRGTAKPGRSVSSIAIDFDELGINDVVDTLRPAKMEAVLRDFGDKNPQEDPVIHFYELFLKEYDAKKRMQRGVFYTPKPVVSFIVRSVHELLQTEFGLADGLADTTTWGEMVKRHPDLKLPTIRVRDEKTKKEVERAIDPGTPFVQILDPATGTATFLVEVIGLIHKTMVAKWQEQGHTEMFGIPDLWNDYVPKHLLPRLHGYELMMAPYAIAHMKIGLKLYETGYRFESDERAHVYLTNSLEPPQDFSGTLAFAIPALAHEAEAVNAIKQDQRFTVVIGNPPYSIQSQNLDEVARRWADRYRYVDGKRIHEKGALQLEKALQDDFVKFSSLSQEQIDKSGTGCVGMIMSHSFIDNPTLRGMRYSLTQLFSGIYVLDLHGNLTRKERCPDGSADKNVFDIRQGVAILVASLAPQETCTTRVRYSEAWGTRKSKYAFLMDNSLATTPLQPVDLASPFYLMKPQDADVREEFECAIKITDVFEKGNVGIITARDNVVIDFEATPLVDRARLFRDSTLPDAQLCAELNMSLKKGWDIRRARNRIKEDKDLNRYVRHLCYRPFDIRRILYHPSLVWGMSYPTMQHMLSGRNLAMMVGRSGQVIGQGEWDIVFCSRAVTEFNLYRRGGHNLFPLYLCNDTEDAQGKLDGHESWHSNFTTSFMSYFSDAPKLSKESQVSTTTHANPEAVFSYIYALLHSCAYRRRYAEFLKIDFPRILLPSSHDLFRDLARLGGKVVALHLMESPKLKDHIATLIGSGGFQVEKVSYSDETVWIDKAKTCGFKGVPEEVWHFHVGGYQVCEKWLKDRQAKGGKNPRPGRVLTDEDISHYQKIVVALNETIRIMQEIDEVIEAHGGWPGA